MNATQLQKHYDKLTPRERYIAKLAAQKRADNNEIAALDRAAPKVRYDVTHHYFYQEAWEHLGTFHLVQMLNMGCAFYQGQGALHITAPGDEWNESADGLYNLLEELGKTIRMIDAAWRKFCEGERMDAGLPMLNVPGSGVYSVDAPINPLNHADTLPELLRFAAVVAPEEPDPAEVEAVAESYRAALHRLAGDQSGGWG